MSHRERLDPNWVLLDPAFRSIGYSFESAVADIVDNSIDAGARDIRTRIIIRSGGQLDLVVWDDGSGMGKSTLREAMRLGSDLSRETGRLGKFGLGLKLASLSQAKGVQVYTWKSGNLSGRGWPEGGIREGFVSTVYTSEESARSVSALGRGFPRASSGTLVHWSELYRIRGQAGEPEGLAQGLMKRLQQHLALSFHRFLCRQESPVRMQIDILEAGTGMPGILRAIEGLDPFGYEKTGNPDFPAEMIPAASCALRIKAHIWSPNSESRQYRLPGGANSRQGFYFYRNGRLIQAGGWNRLREAEPHLSLARVEIDVGPELDLEFSLDVRKAEIQLPKHLANAIEKSSTREGMDFGKYLGLARKAYSSKARNNKELPLVPTSGLPSGLRNLMRRELCGDGKARTRDLSFRWEKLPEDLFFEIDRERRQVVLNKSWRRKLRHGLAGSPADVPVVKCLLFLLLREAFDSDRTGPRARKLIDQANRFLVAAVQNETE